MSTDYYELNFELIRQDANKLGYTKVDKTAVRVSCKFIYSVLYNEKALSLESISNYGCL